MQAMRIVESPKEGKITIELPHELKTKKKVEIIVLPYEERRKKKKKAFEPRKFRGAGKLNMTMEEIERESRKLRDEWNRNF